jgi:hypothetical protein
MAFNQQFGGKRREINRKCDINRNEKVKLSIGKSMPTKVFPPFFSFLPGCMQCQWNIFVIDLVLTVQSFQINSTSWNFLSVSC